MLLCVVIVIVNVVVESCVVVSELDDCCVCVTCQEMERDFKRRGEEAEAAARLEEQKKVWHRFSINLVFF